jgi:hypothetical protein
MDEEERISILDPNYDHDYEVAKRIFSHLARMAVEDEDMKCDPISVAKALRDLSFLASSCDEPELHYSFLQGWYEITDHSVGYVEHVRRKEAKLLKTLDDTSTHQ